MRVMNLVRKTILWFMGIIMTLPGIGRAEDKQVENKKIANQKQEEQYSKPQFSKNDLIDALEQLNRKPQEVKIISAMCYEMAVSPKEIDYQCPICGKKTTHSMDKGQGALVQGLEYIKRSLKQIPYDISVDASALCSNCNKDKDPELVMNISCFGCGKKFSWKVRTQEDINMLQWLYIKPPFKEIDGNYLNIWGNAEPEEHEKIKKGVNYIAEHVFCLECRKQLKLGE